MLVIAQVVRSAADIFPPAFSAGKKPSEVFQRRWPGVAVEFRERGIVIGSRLLEYPCLNCDIFDCAQAAYDAQQEQQSQQPVDNQQEARFAYT